MTQPMPSEDLKHRVMLSIDSAPALPRSREAVRTTLVLTGAWLLSFGIYARLGGIRQTGRPLALTLGTAVGSLAVAVIGLHMLAGRDRKMSGRPRPLLVALVISLPVALLLWKVGYSAQFVHGLDRWITRIGYRCLQLCLAVGVMPVMALVYVRRGTNPSHPATAGLALGVSVGLVVAVLVDLWCPVAYVPHLLVGHLLPIAMLGALGSVVGRRLLSG